MEVILAALKSVAAISNATGYNEYGRLAFIGLTIALTTEGLARKVLRRRIAGESGGASGEPKAILANKGRFSLRRPQPGLAMARAPCRRGLCHGTRRHVLAFDELISELAHHLPNYGTGVDSSKVMRVIERSKVGDDQWFDACQGRQTSLCRLPRVACPDFSTFVKKLPAEKSNDQGAPRRPWWIPIWADFLGQPAQGLRPACKLGGPFGRHAPVRCPSLEHVGQMDHVPIAKLVALLRPASL